MSNIHKSFAIGNNGEKILLDYLNSIQIECGKNTDDAKHEYDVWCKLDGFTWTFEVKADVMSMRTGNLAIEFFNSRQKKPSGISATKADFWVLTFGHEMEGLWITKVEMLRDYLSAHKPKKKMHGIGDGNADIMLYPKEKMLKDLFVNISGLNQLMFKRTLYELR